MRKNNKNTNKMIFILILFFVIILIILFVYFIGLLSKEGKENKNVEVSIDETYNPNKIEENVILQKLSQMSEKERMEYYFSSFISAVEVEKYEKAYNMLYDGFKSSYFPDLETFEKYAKTRFSKMISIKHLNFERNGEYYVLWIEISNPLSGKDTAKEMNIVIQENALNDFVMSFSVI